MKWSQPLFRFLLLTTLSFLIASCGADKLKPTLNTSQSNLACTSEHSPVCGADDKDYDNSCLAQSFGTTVKSVGHCKCENNLILVCGSDGLDHTECDAKSSGIAITKFIPCGATGI